MKTALRRPVKENPARLLLLNHFWHHGRMSESTSPVGSGNYTRYHIERHHHSDSGLVQIPIAGPDPQASTFVKCHATVETEAVYWSAKCEGSPPQIPSWRALAGQNRVFLEGYRTADVPPPLIGLTHIFTCAGVYFYAIIAPEYLDSTFRLGKQPFDAGVISLDNFIPAAAWAEDLLPKSPVPSIPDAARIAALLAPPLGNIRGG